MTSFRWGRGFRIAGALVAIATLASLTDAPPARGFSGEVCTPDITDWLRKELKRIAYSRKEEKIALNCHHFKMRVQIRFVRRDKQYEIFSDLEHLVDFDINETATAHHLVSEDGKILKGYYFRIVPELHTHPFSSDAWKPYARKLTMEIGRIVQNDVQALMKKCDDASGSTARDHREASQIKCHLPGVVIDARS